MGNRVCDQSQILTQEGTAFSLQKAQCHLGFRPELRYSEGWKGNHLVNKEPCQTVKPVLLDFFLASFVGKTNRSEQKAVRICRREAVGQERLPGIRGTISYNACFFSTNLLMYLVYRVMMWR